MRGDRNSIPAPPPAPPAPRGAGGTPEGRQTRLGLSVSVFLAGRIDIVELQNPGIARTVAGRKSNDLHGAGKQKGGGPAATLSGRSDQEHLSRLLMTVENSVPWVILITH